MNNNYKNLTLTSQNNILKNIECYELIDRPKLELLMISTLLQQDLRYKQIYETEKDHLINYISRIEGDNRIKVIYNKDKYGRTLPIKSLGLHNIRRPIRQTISNKYYEDIDIENCHPQILHQILEHNKINNECLSKYIYNRDYYLKMVMDQYNINKDEAKKLFIRMLYGGSYNKWLKDNKFNIINDEIQKFNEELWIINDIIVKENEELNKWVLNKHSFDTHKKINYNSSVVAYYLQEKEVQILEQLYIYSVDKGYIEDNNVVLCADGLMILKENYNDNILLEYENIINERFDMKLKFIKKEMKDIYNEEYINDNLDIPDIKEINKNIEKINSLDIDSKSINNELENLYKKKKKLICDKLTNLNKEILKGIKNYNNQLNKLKQETEKKKLMQENEAEKIARLQEKNDLNIQLKIKKIEVEMDKKMEYINHKENKFIEQYNNELNIYNEYKKDFEQYFFKIEEPILYVYCNKDKIKFYDIKALNEHCCDKYVKLFIERKKPGEYTEISFINKWRIDEMKRKYNKIIFNPNLNDLSNNGCYNLFKGFKLNNILLEPIRNKNSYFFKLLKHLCNNSKLEYSYIKEWIAHIVQKPYKKTNVAIILYSKIGGIGKNAFIDGLLKLFEGYTSKIESIDDITNRFNDNQCNKLLIYGDEINARATKLADRLKSIITRSELVLEKKGHDSVILNDYSNWIFTTNNELAFKIEENSRRMFMVECNNERLNKEDYINYYNEINNNESIQQIFNYFLNYKVNNYDIGISPVPDTKYKKRLEFESYSATTQYIYKHIHKIYNYEISGLELYNNIKEYAIKNYITVPSMTESGRICTEIFKENKIKQGGSVIYKLENLKNILIKYDKKYYEYIHNN